jgi:hypothetical protein
MCSGVTSPPENKTPLLSVSRLFLVSVLMTLLAIFVSELISNVVKINLTGQEPCMYPEAVSSENLLTAYETRYFTFTAVNATGRILPAVRIPHLRLF